MSKKLSIQEKMRRGKIKKKRVMYLSRQTIQPVQDRKWYKKKPTKEESSLKKKLLIFFGIFLIFLNIGLLAFHPFFSITTVQTTGIQRINQTEFDHSIENIMNYRRFFIFPATNYFFVHITEIEEILLNKFPLLSVQVQKEFPNTLKLTIEERISTIIYDNGESYSSIDLFGKIIEPLQKVGEDEWTIITETVTSTDPETGDVIEKTIEIDRYHTPDFETIRQKIGEYPLVYDSAPSNTEEKIPEDTLKDIVDWYYFFDRKLGIRLNYTQMGESPYHGTLHSSAGWYIEVNFVESAQAQQRIVQEVLNTQIAGQPFQYMDVRFTEKVFWK